MVASTHHYQQWPQCSVTTQHPILIWWWWLSPPVQSWPNALTGRDKIFNVKKVMHLNTLDECNKMLEQLLGQFKAKFSCLGVSTHYHWIWLPSTFSALQTCVKMLKKSSMWPHITNKSWCSDVNHFTLDKNLVSAKQNSSAFSVSTHHYWILTIVQHWMATTPPQLVNALIRSMILNAKNVKHFTLDKCDKMLELG